MSSVNFPVENFQPSMYLGMNDKNDDTTYDLIASVNHQRQPNGGGHYYAICRQTFWAGGTNMMTKMWRQQILPKAKAFVQ